MTFPFSRQSYQLYIHTDSHSQDIRIPLAIKERQMNSTGRWIEGKHFRFLQNTCLKHRRRTHLMCFYRKEVKREDRYREFRIPGRFLASGINRLFSNVLICLASIQERSEVGKVIWLYLKCRWLKDVSSLLSHKSHVLHRSNAFYYKKREIRLLFRVGFVQSALSRTFPSWLLMTDRM